MLRAARCTKKTYSPVASDDEEGVVRAWRQFAKLKVDPGRKSSRHGRQWAISGAGWSHILYTLGGKDQVTGKEQVDRGIARL